MNEQHLTSLLEQMNRGDERAEEELFRAHEPFLRMVVRRLLPQHMRSHFDSADVVQSAWADVLEGFRNAGWRFTDERHLRAFLTRVVRNRLIDHVRHTQFVDRHEHGVSIATLEHVDDRVHSTPSQEAEAEELWEQMMALCSPAHQEILKLRREGLSLQEIAARRGMHEGSVRRVLYDLARRLALRNREAATVP